MKTTISVAVCLISSACTSESTPVREQLAKGELTFPIEVSSVEQGSHNTYTRTVPLCEHWSDAIVAGEFNVERIVHDIGTAPRRSSPGPVTTVELKADDLWKGSGDPTILMRGGLFPNGDTATLPHGFTVGETVVAFLRSRSGPNGEFGITGLEIFHLERHGGFANEQILWDKPYSALDVKAMVMANPCEEPQVDGVSRDGGIRQGEDVHEVLADEPDLGP